MNSSDTLLLLTQTGRLPWFKRAGVLAVLLPCLGLTGCLRVSSDAEALRNGLLKSAAVKWDKTIEIEVGTLTVNLVRLGLSFVDLPAEARSALRAVRGAEVGVYRLRPTDAERDHAAWLAAADRAMEARGWDRLVGVLSSRELVAVYVPGHAKSPKDLKVCVAVMNRQELVIAAARSNLEPLMDLAFQQIDSLPNERGLVH